MKLPVQRKSLPVRLQIRLQSIGVFDIADRAGLCEDLVLVDDLRVFVDNLILENDVLAEAVRGQLTGWENAAAEQESAIAVLQTGMDHNRESLQRLEQEMAESESRTENLQSQMDAKAERLTEIDAETGRRRRGRGRPRR